jgi:predicted Fe-Mo cluster-binding NifX family protein
MRFAIALRRGLEDITHFGQADAFYICDLHEWGITFSDLRYTTPYGGGESDHAFRPERFEPIGELLRDCNRVFVRRIGDEPARKLADRGIDAVTFDGDMNQLFLLTIQQGAHDAQT